MSVHCPRRRVPRLALVALLGLGIASLPTSAHAVEKANDFVKDASVGNQFEIQSSQMALQKSQNDKIKKFAQQMLDDHTQAGEDLKSAVSGAPDADIEVPADTLDSKHQKMLSKLGDTSGKDFDKLYVKDQVKAHDEAVSLFKDYAADGDNKSLKAFASHTLPTLQAHQQYIEKIDSSM